MKLKYFLKNCSYLWRHKWFVMLECFKRGIYWRGLTHDLSKVLPDEFVPYGNYFGRKADAGSTGRDKTGYYKATDTGDPEFDFSWLLHQKRNKHHWQWWMLPEDEGGLKVLEMPCEYVIEMVCDWVGAGRAQGYTSPADDPYLETRKWYEANGSKMTLHPRTRKLVEEIINGTKTN